MIRKAWTMTVFLEQFAGPFVWSVWPLKSGDFLRIEPRRRRIQVGRGPVLSQAPRTLIHTWYLSTVPDSHGPRTWKAGLCLCERSAVVQPFLVVSDYFPWVEGAFVSLTDEVTNLPARGRSRANAETLFISLVRPPGNFRDGND